MTAPTPTHDPGPAPRRKKKRGRLLLVALAVVAVVAMASAVAGGGGEEPAPEPAPAAVEPAPGPNPAPAPAPAPAAGDDLSDKGWTASDVQVERSQFGDAITGRVTNTDDQARSALFTLTIFGPDGARLGQTSGSAQEVAAGDTVTVTFIGRTATERLPGDPATYRFQLQTDMTY